MTMRGAKQAFCAAWILVTLSCMGGTNRGPSEEVASVSTKVAVLQGTSLPPVNPCVTQRPAPRILRRLTATEYNNTLRDLFKSAAVPQASFINDAPVYAFTNNADVLTVGGSLTQELLMQAESVAAWAQANLTTFMPCSTQDAACEAQFIGSFGARAFRRPLSSDEKALFTGLFDAEKANSGFTGAVGLVVATLLQSPGFLYRSELGTVDAQNSKLYHLSPFETASALSYLFIQSMPDDTLLAAANANQLSTRDAIAAQAQRLLLNSGPTLMQPFTAALYKINSLATVTRDAALYAALTPAVRQDMLAEAASLAQDVTFGKNGNFSDLFTASGAVSPNLAAYYGSGPRVPGILGLGALLTANADVAQSSPVLRGKLVRERLFCLSIPPPPPNLDTTLHPAPDAKTTRQHFENHVANPACASCHSLMDPIGFGFENYDGAGQYRSQENGVSIDSSGSLAGVGMNDPAITGLADLSSQVSHSDAAAQCFARNAMVYAYGLTTWPEDGCTLDALVQDAQAHGYNLQQLLLGITRTDSFTTRSAP